MMEVYMKVLIKQKIGNLLIIYHLHNFIKLLLMMIIHFTMFTEERRIIILKVKIPSRTDNIHGIRNSDWFILLGGDGHQPATDSW